MTAQFEFSSRRMTQDPEQETNNGGAKRRSMTLAVPDCAEIRRLKQLKASRETDPLRKYSDSRLDVEASARSPSEFSPSGTGRPNGWLASSPMAQNPDEIVRENHHLLEKRRKGSVPLERTPSRRMSMAGLSGERGRVFLP